MMIQKHLPIEKYCGNCGQVHNRIPSSARALSKGDPLDGLYWECTCGSTVFLSDEQIEHSARKLFDLNNALAKAAALFVIIGSLAGCASTGPKYVWVPKEGKSNEQVERDKTRCKQIAGTLQVGGAKQHNAYIQCMLMEGHTLGQLEE